jgi:predicted regulator of Ras-like GTPase activity (Roadblock/LC7/MglB family)
MPLTGTLHDLSLANLVQVQCSEQHQAQVTLTRGPYKGTLVFADGELIFARANDQVGENAVYELLTWEEASFRVENEAIPSERNVTTPWSALLIEGLHRADESRAERDTKLETHLRDLQGKQGIRAALVVRPDGGVRADARGEVVTEEPVAILQAVANVERISALLGLGAPRQIVLINSTEKIWLQKLDNDFLACWLDGRASIEPLKAMLQPLTETHG